jgi:hypothetical protein
VANENLIEAKRNKQDEFYTQLSDIEKELRYYKAHFAGKSVLCNCDDPFESNFFKYFALNFKELGLRKLVAISYAHSPFSGTQLSLFDDEDAPRPYKIEITEIPDMNQDGAVDLSDVELLLKSDKNVLVELRGNGDFRSEEAEELLRDADVVVTNPPFSLFREFFLQIRKHKKKFLVLGNHNAHSYKEIWPLLHSGEIWLGTKSGDMSFRVPEYYEARPTRFWVDDAGKKWRSFGNICWFTNLDHPKRHEELALYRKFDPNQHFMYDFYDAINIDAVKEIPSDYFGAMGVPITFLAAHNPDQFELLDANEIRKGAPLKPHGLIKDKDSAVAGKAKFVRIVIRRKK